MVLTLIFDAQKRRSEPPGAAAAGISLPHSRGRCGDLLAGLGLLLALSPTLCGQGPTVPANPEITSIAADAAPEWQSAPFADAGSFSSRVKARFQAARKGTILILMPQSCKVGETVQVRVIVQRAPAGADGLLLNSTNNQDGVTAVLKVDDEMAVELAADAAAPIQITSQDPHPQLPLHRILAGGHSEWVWSIKPAQAGEQRLAIASDVVYRRNFLNYDPPIIRFQSHAQSLALQVLP